VLKIAALATGSRLLSDKTLNRCPEAFSDIKKRRKKNALNFML
jgi:hypothetical protein